MCATLVLANNYEFFSPLDALMPPANRECLQQISLAEAELDLFWSFGPTCAVLPCTSSTDLVQTVRRLLRISELEMVHPARTSQGLCSDILADPAGYGRVLEFVARHQDVRVLAWGPTSGLLALIARLQADAGPGVVLRPEFGPHTSLPSPGGLGSKGWLRLVASGNGGNRGGFLRLPEGYWVDPEVRGRDAVVSAILSFLEQGRPCLVKPDNAFGGWGILKFSPGPVLPTRAQVRERLAELDREYGELTAIEPVIVEEFIEPQIAGGVRVIPTVDALVGPSGRVNLQFSALMRISDDFIYHGVEVGRHALPGQLDTYFRGVAEECGHLLFAAGYTGWFDVDLVCARDGAVYCTEINARRTAPIYAHCIWSAVQSRYPSDEIHLVSNEYALMPPQWKGDYRRLRDEVRDLLWNDEAGGQGAMLTMATPLDLGLGYCGYVVFGRGRDEARALEQELVRRLRLL